MEAETRPPRAKGPIIGREFDPGAAGGPIRQDGEMRSVMASQDARLTLLRLIEEHQGEWGWYQFERAFPPGWFTGESPTVKAKDILDRLEADGLVTTTPGEPQRRYRLTDRGMQLLREIAVGSTSA